MLKIKLTITLALSIFSTLSVAANSAYLSSSNMLSTGIAFSEKTLVDHASFAVAWPSAGNKGSNNKTAYGDDDEIIEQSRESTGTSDAITMQPTVNVPSPFPQARLTPYGNSLDTDSGAWFGKVYRAASPSKGWDSILDTTGMNISTVNETDDSSLTIATPSQQNPNWVLLLFALIGWGVVRRFQNKPTLDETAQNSDETRELSR